MHTTHNCQNITSAPLMRRGAISAEYIGTVAFLAPLKFQCQMQRENLKFPCHTDANAQDEACSKESLPRLCKGGANRCGSKTGGGNEDFSPTTEVIVQRVNNPGTAA